MTRLIPGLAGSAPSRTRCRNSAVLRACTPLIKSLAASASANSEAIRSLPPPIFTFSA